MGRKVKVCTNPDWFRESNENMPELPEVETIKRQLCELLYDSPQEWDMRVDWYQMFVTNNRTQVVRIQRKGKNLCFYGKDFRVRNHLRMTGRLRVVRTMESSAEELAAAFKHVKAIFSFFSRREEDDSFRIVYTDTRGFGVCQVTTCSDPMEDFPEVRQLGIDPTYPDEFTLNKFTQAILTASHTRIGSVLMRQDIIAGIGNIYRSEILHHAGIHPCKAPYELSSQQMAKLYDSTIRVLSQGIEYGGCSIKDYRDLHSNEGKMGDHLMVYQRKDLPCLNCGKGAITSFDIENLRRIYYCNNCQT